MLPNGNLASGSFDSTIKIWNTDNSSLIRTITGHIDWIMSLAVLQNGYLASGSIYDNTDTGSLNRNLRGHLDLVSSLAVLINGFLASGDGAGVTKILKIWKFNSNTKSS